MWLKFHSNFSARTPYLESVDKPGIVATLGNFDGFHQGHQDLLTRVKDIAVEQKLSSALITFSPHPAKVLSGRAPPRITKLGQLISLTREFGINQMMLLRFNRKLAALSAEEFMDSILIQRFGVRHLVIGPFATIGKDRLGTPQAIVDHFEKRGLKASVESPSMIDSNRISSNLIRKLIADGQFAEVKRALGRPFTVSARVHAGDRRGRSLGFPTANVKLSGYVKPLYGVYFTITLLEGVSYNSISNFGIRPSIGGQEELLETFILDYHGSEFYGQKIAVTFLEKLRAERSFDSIERLQLQINEDVKAAKDFFEKP